MFGLRSRTVSAWLIVMPWLWALFAPAWSQTQAGFPSPLNLAPTVSYLVDPSGSLTIEQVRSPLFADKFKTPSLHGRDLNFGFTKATYWIRFSLARPRGGAPEALLGIPYLTLDEVSLFAPGKPPVVTGNLQPFSSRPVRSHFFVFPLTLSDTPETFYLRVHSNYALTVPLELWEPDAYYAHVEQRSGLQALYFGELLSLLVYNFLLFVYLRDRSFLLYTLFGVSMGMAMFAGNGLGRIYLWQNAPYWDEVAQAASLCLAAFFGLLFSATFLNTRVHTPRLHRLIRAQWYSYPVLAALLALAHPLGIPTTPLFVATALIAPQTGLLLVGAGLVTWRAGQRKARFFLLAWGLLWTGGTIAALRAIGIVPTNVLTSYAIQISSAIEMLLLSFALADRVRIERLAHEQAQVARLAAEQALVQTLKDSEQRLEQTVQRRTQELQLTLANERKLRDQHARFGAMISHEFRNPLNVIDSQVSVWKRERARGIDHTEQRMSVISQTTHRLSALFDQWILSGRLNDPLEHTALEWLPLGRWLPDTISALQTQYEQHRLVCLPIPDLGLCADAQLVDTALHNLIDNACKYSAAHTTITVSVQLHDGMIGIAVHDQGCGISAEHQRMIFDEYFRVNPASPVRGNGLGLAFVRKIMELHDGWVEVSSSPGDGSCFYLWFPQQPADLPPA